MKRATTNILWIVILATMLLTACRSKRIAPAPTQEVATWHTCLIQNAEATLYMQDNTVRSMCTIHTTHDSLIILSVMPMLGIEMFRLEATPSEVVIIDKMQRQYLRTTYEEANRVVAPRLQYSVLEQLATGEVITPNETQARIYYQVDKYRVGLSIRYPARQIDVPVQTRQLDLTRYQAVSIDTLLQ